MAYGQLVQNEKYRIIDVFGRIVPAPIRDIALRLIN